MLGATLHGRDWSETSVRLHACKLESLRDLIKPRTPHFQLGQKDGGRERYFLLLDALRRLSRVGNICGAQRTKCQVMCGPLTLSGMQLVKGHSNLQGIKVGREKAVSTMSYAAFRLIPKSKHSVSLFNIAYLHALSHQSTLSIPYRTATILGPKALQLVNMSTTQKSEDVYKKAVTAWQDPTIAARYARAEAATIPYASIILDKASIVSNIKQHNSTVNALDFGCGTGAVTAVLYDTIPKENWGKVKVLGGDISQPMLTYLEERGEKNGWTGLSTQIVDGANIQLEDNQFTHIFANAIIFFLPLGTLSKLFNLLQPGGFVGLTTWATLSWYSHLERAVKNMANPPPLPPFAELRDSLQKNNAWHEPSFVKQQLEEAGFQDVDIVVEKKNVPCGTPQEFCESMRVPLTMLTGQWSENERQEILKDVLAELKKVMLEEAGGKEEQCYMAMEGIVGSGWKPVGK